MLTEGNLPANIFKNPLKNSILATSEEFEKNAGNEMVTNTRWHNLSATDKIKSHKMYNKIWHNDY